MPEETLAGGHVGWSDSSRCSTGGSLRRRLAGTAGMDVRTNTADPVSFTSPARASSTRCTGRGRERPRAAAVASRSRSATAPGPRTAVQYLRTYGCEAG